MLIATSRTTSQNGRRQLGYIAASYLTMMCGHAKAQLFPHLVLVHDLAHVVAPQELHDLCTVAHCKWGWICSTLIATSRATHQNGRRRTAR